MKILEAIGWRHVENTVVTVAAIARQALWRFACALLTRCIWHLYDMILFGMPATMSQDLRFADLLSWTISPLPLLLTLMPYNTLASPSGACPFRG
jgi:hypothetical protein